MNAASSLIVPNYTVYHANIDDFLGDILKYDANIHQ